MEKRPLLYSLRFVIISVLTVAIILTLGFALGGYLKKGKTFPALPSSTKSAQVTFVIDPGHGGEDSGAIADDMTLEKDLNLEIAKVLYALYELNGTPSKMTREDDRLLYDYYKDLDDYKGQKKVYDLKNRLKIAEEYENPVFIGIHMNKFPQKKYSGLTVYYSKNDPQSRLIASCISDYNKKYIQPQNNREIKSADSSIYILHNIKSPAVLVECGFVSNDTELALLKDKGYREKMAVMLFASSLNFCTE